MQTGIIYISIHLMFLLIGITGVIIRAGSGDFNTSHVSINQIWIQMHNVWHQYFNTSHVSINLLSAAFQICSKLNFNTSHVSINLRIACSDGLCKPISIHLMFLLIIISLQDTFNHMHISIHLMFLLISLTIAAMYTDNYFNTSHVSINQGINTDSIGIRNVFQYISCFY